MDAERRERPTTLRWRGDDWKRVGESSFGWGRGYAFLEDGRCLEDHEIATHLCRNRARLEREVAGMNGCFAAAVDCPPHAPALITDRYGTTPIFVARGAGGVFAAADPWQLAGSLDSRPELDESGAIDMLRTGYVLGTRTLISQIETVPPATVMCVVDGELRLTRYWRYGYRPSPCAPDVAEERLAAILGRVAERTARYFESHDYRPALTLSGGLDSRVLAALLPNAFSGVFTALTYGQAGDPEVDVAHRVAETVGLRFRSTTIDPGCLLGPTIEQSVRDVGMTTRFTCGLGVRQLDTSGVDVLVPGHTGDFISGGHLPVQVGMVRSRAQLRRYLEFAHFRYRGSETVLRDVLRLDYDSMKAESLEATIADYDLAEDTLGLVDRWNVENRQRRLILTELRSYERRGRWALPFYDHELVDFFATVPHELRLGQMLYIETARRRIFRGRAEPLARLTRVGGRPMTPDPGLARRLRRQQGLQPASGWFLQFCLPAYRDLLRTLRPRSEQRFGVDPIKAWFRSDAAVRDYLLDRVAALELDVVDTERLLARLRSEREEERVYHRVLPGVLTLDECLRQARHAWSHERSVASRSRSAAVEGADAGA